MYTYLLQTELWQTEGVICPFQLPVNVDYLQGVISEAVA